MTSNFHKLLFVFIASIVCVLPATGLKKHSVKSSGTVSMDLRDNRVFVTLTAIRPNGTRRTARFLVDTGGGSVILAKSLAESLGLKAIGPVFEEEGDKYEAFTAPKIKIGGMLLDFRGVPVIVAAGSKKEFMPGAAAEGFLPARFLKNYQVIFDYPARTFTLAEPGTLKHRGIPVPSPVQPETGFPRVELAIDGNQYGFLLDTGGAYTMISRTTIDKWVLANPSWPHAMGAVGAANMVGRLFDTDAQLLRIPLLQWGRFDLHEVGAVSRPPGTYEKWMSRQMTAPIVGALAGNALRAFRIEIDYAHGVTYLEKQADVNPNDLDVVGIVIHAAPDGTYAIDGVAKKDGKAAVVSVEPGDRLLRVDRFACTGASLSDVLRALRGEPGQVKTLVLERTGKTLTVQAPVMRFP